MPKRAIYQVTVLLNNGAVIQSTQGEVTIPDGEADQAEETIHANISQMWLAELTSFGPFNLGECEGTELPLFRPWGRIAVNAREITALQTTLVGIHDIPEADPGDVAAAT